MFTFTILPLPFCTDKRTISQPLGVIDGDWWLYTQSTSGHKFHALRSLHDEVCYVEIKAPRDTPHLAAALSLLANDLLHPTPEQMRPTISILFRLGPERTAAGGKGALPRDFQPVTYARQDQPLSGPTAWTQLGLSISRTITAYEIAHDGHGCDPEPAYEYLRRHCSATWAERIYPYSSEAASAAMEIDTKHNGISAWAYVPLHESSATLYHLDLRGL